MADPSGCQHRPNSVMATKIVDKEVGALCKARWAKTFAKKNTNNDRNVEQAIIDNEFQT